LHATENLVLCVVGLVVSESDSSTLVGEKLCLVARFLQHNHTGIHRVESLRTLLLLVTLLSSPHTGLWLRPNQQFSASVIFVFSFIEYLNLWKNGEISDPCPGLLPCWLFHGAMCRYVSPFRAAQLPWLISFPVRSNLLMSSGLGQPNRASLLSCPKHARQTET